MFSFFSRKPKTPQKVEQIVHASQWSDAEIPRYPPFMKGLPVIDPEQLLDTQAELLQRIKSAAVATPEIFETHYMAAIRRYASYVHLLPASQSHHHRGAGGLLRHALEVGLWALQACDKIMLKGAISPAQKRELEPRWQLAVFLAAMCHDAGKPVTDANVTNLDRTLIWNPLIEDLHSWASRNNLKAYYLDWKEGRGRQHTALSSLVGERIMGIESLGWINQGDTELVVWVMESLSCNPGPSNRIHDLVVKADQTSVERDLKTLGVAMAGYDIGVPVERHLSDMMRRLVRESRWLVNEPGARIWCIEGAIYLVWPAAGEELAKEARDDGVPGIPRTPDGMLDMLLERKLASMLETAEGSQYWEIAPTVLAEKIPNIKLRAIRLKDDTLVSTQPIGQVEGKVLLPGSAEIAQPENIESTSSESKSESLATTNEDLTHGAQSAEQVEAVDQDSTKPDVENKRADKQVQAAHGAEIKPVPPMAQGAQDSIKSNTAAGAPQVAKAKKQAASKVEPDEPKVDFTGATGEAFKALAMDLSDGDKQWGVDASRHNDGTVQLRWPEAFAGYGLTGKSLMDDMTAKGWLQGDPLNPLKRTVAGTFKNGAANAVHLSHSASKAFLSLIGVTEPVKVVLDDQSTDTVAVQDQQTCTDVHPTGDRAPQAAPLEQAGSTGEKVPGQKRNRKAKPSEKQEAKPEPRSSDMTPAAMSAPPPLIDMEGATDTEQPSTDALDDGEQQTAARKVDSYALDDLMAALQSVPANIEGPYCRLNFSEVRAAFRSNGIDLFSYQHFRRLADKSEGRIVIYRNTLKYKH